MLDGLINRAKEVLTIDPANRAALKAKRLAETEKHTLQDEYFAHAEKECGEELFLSWQVWYTYLDQ